MLGSKGLNPLELAHRWVKDLGTRPDIRIKVGAFPPDIIILYNENQYQGKKGRNHLTGTCLLFF